jgi:NhaP-type Na+/H+ or K+/H+ antiporter
MNATYLAIVVVSFLSTVLGLFVGYQAYRGFRRHESTSMQYLSVGLILLTAVTFTTAFVGSALLQFGAIDASFRQPFTLVVRLCQLLGLACIAYSLYRRP